MKINFLKSLLALMLLVGCTTKKRELVEVRNIPIELSNINQDKLLMLINEARSKPRKCGVELQEAVEPLVWNETLERLAYNHSKDMTQNNFFSHTGSDGKLPSQRLDAIGYTWNRSAENLATGYPNEKKVVAGWLKSPQHCFNIMAVYLSQIGIAKDGKYWTSVFTN